MLASRTDLDVAVSRVYSEYKAAAKKFKRTFQLDLVCFAKIVQACCYYCGASPFAGPSSRTSRVTIPLNGVDRVDSRVGYIETNVVSCCKFCNIAKRDRSAEDFIAHCKLVAQKWST